MVMAHVAQTTTRLSASMSPHIWHPHPSPHQPSSATPTSSTTTAQRLWPSPDLSANQPSSPSPSPAVSQEADIMFHNLLNMHIDPNTSSSYHPPSQYDHPSLHSTQTPPPYTTPDFLNPRVSLPTDDSDLGPPSRPPTQGSSNIAPRIKNELYKTEICRSFAETGGFCKYGSKCQFAHGDVELRPVRRHPRYKTKLCRNFVTTGSCPYDARCRFIHASDLPYSQQPNTSTAIPPRVASPPASLPGSLGFPSQLAVVQPAQTHTQSRSADPLQIPRPRDKYSDNLHRFFGLSTSTPTTSSPLNLDPILDSINPDYAPLAPSSSLDMHQLHSVLPTPTDHDLLYHANVFQNYNDNAFHHTFMHLTGPPPETAQVLSAELSDQDPPLNPASLHLHAATPGVVGSDPAPDAFSTDSLRESLFSQPAPTNRSVSPATSGPLPRDGSGLLGNVAPASSPAPRSRLPVFRNMASDADEN